MATQPNSINYQWVRLGFRQQMNLLSGGAPIMAFPNRDFDPKATPADATTKVRPPFVEEVLVPGTQPRVSTGFIETRSMMIYNVKVPKNTGTDIAELLQHRLATHFMAGTTISYETYKIQIQRTEQMPGDIEDIWYVAPVHVTFMLHVPVAFGA